ncbi:HAD-IB family phosphatase [Candidatus Pacearchaeota archaeon]|nr:HAD-IB family phosphatase [Candidatus Pacearchaeota archaeon]
MKKIKLIVTDFDGCLVKFENEPYNSSWDAMGLLLPDTKKRLWFSERDRYIDLIHSTEEIERKIEIDKEWFYRDLSLLAGESVNYFLENIFPLNYTSGAKEFFSSVKKNGQKIGILSAGLDFIIEKSAKELNMDFYICSEAEIKNRVLTGKGNFIVTLFNKDRHFSNLLANYSLKKENSCYFGDNFNCISCIEKAGLGIAVNAKTKAVEDAAKYSINDFMQAIPLIEEYKGEK